MPVTHEIDEARHVITMTVTPPITPQELTDDYQKIFENQKFRHNINAVWDVSRIELSSISVDHIRNLPRRMQQFMQQRGEGYKAALVSSRPFDFQLLRAYLTILRLIGNIRFRVFRSLDEAYEWVAEAGREDA